jgi:hypothetical protein
MTVYTISELVNQITDRIYENLERRISGVDLQEILIDIIDSLVGYTGGQVTASSERRAGQESLISGLNNISFSSSFDVGTNYILLKAVISDSDGYDIGGTISSKTVSGFSITVPESATLSYLAIPLES